MAAADPLIVKTIQRYHPEWVQPKPGRNKWLACRCPFHGDENPSAGVSYTLNAFTCHVCGVSGDVIKLIRDNEGEGVIPYSTAKQIAEGLAEGSDGEIPAVVSGKPSRTVPVHAGFGDHVGDGTSRDRPVHAGVRRRTFGGP